MQHPACALAEVRRLRVENAQLRAGIIEPDWIQRIRQGGIVPCGEDATIVDTLTREAQAMGMYDTQSGPHLAGHTVTLKLHAPGPTWSHHNDEPPSR